MLRLSDSKLQIPASSSFLMRGHLNFEREYARWLGRVEQRAILPMKWGILGICLLYWMWVREWMLPTTAAFAVFFIYAAFNGAQHYLFFRDRIAISQVRPVVYISYFVDLFFITSIIYLDVHEPVVGAIKATPGSDFYILYLLLILRGFALFRTPVENLLVTALISVLFIISLVWTGQEMTDFATKTVVLRLALIWAIMLLSTFIVNIVTRQQEEVLRVRERLLKTENLAALGELTAGVAHEINNPIGIIKTYADYLKRTSDKEDAHYEDFETIHMEAERCERIVRRMLDFANPNVRALEKFDMKELVEETIAFVFHNKGEQSIKTELLVDGRLPSVEGDLTQIKQALMNIMMNARQILNNTKDGEGEVVVRLRQLSGPRAPVEVAIHDNGPGISAQDAERAFEPFFTRRGGGTGLGLAITRRIIEAHDGTIEIWPAADGGTTCTVTLPVAGEE